MAISRNPLKLTGRFGFLTFYKVGEQIRIRIRKPLSRKRVLKSPEFRNTMKCARRMARASKIGSAVYQALPKDFRQFWMYRAFVGEAMIMLKQGVLTDQEVFNVLWKMYAELWYSKPLEKDIRSATPVEIKQTVSPPGIQPCLHWKDADPVPARWNIDKFKKLKSFRPLMRAP